MNPLVQPQLPPAVIQCSRGIIPIAQIVSMEKSDIQGNVVQFFGPVSIQSPQISIKFPSLAERDEAFARYTRMINEYYQAMMRK